MWRHSKVMTSYCTLSSDQLCSKKMDPEPGQFDFTNTLDSNLGSTMLSPIWFDQSIWQVFCFIAYGVQMRVRWIEWHDDTYAWHICLCSFRWPWPKVIVGRQLAITVGHFLRDLEFENVDIAWPSWVFSSCAMKMRQNPLPPPSSDILWRDPPPPTPAYEIFFGENPLPTAQQIVTAMFERQFPSLITCPSVSGYYLYTSVRILPVNRCQDITCTPVSGCYLSVCVRL